jgi:hypothetical protein
VLGVDGGRGRVAVEADGVGVDAALAQRVELVEAVAALGLGEGDVRAGGVAAALSSALGRVAFVAHSSTFRPAL